jgi:hypothetical protein
LASCSGIGNHDIDVVNALGLEHLGSGSGVGLDRGVILDDYERGVFGLGEIEYGSGGGVGRIAVGSDNEVIWLCEVELEEALADSAVTAGDEDDGGCHLAGIVGLELVLK